MKTSASLSIVAVIFTSLGLIKWEPLFALGDEPLKTKNLQFESMVGNCLDANTGQSGEQTYMRPCEDRNNPNLFWDMVPFRNGYQLRTRTTGFCLDANTGAPGEVTYMRACDNGENPNLVWRLHSMGSSGQGFQIRTQTTQHCLDANTGALGEKTYMRECDTGANPNLRWRNR